MRTSALLFTTMFALASGSAFALGDRAKEKKAADSNTTQATEQPSGSGAPNTTKGMQSTPSSTSATTNGAASAPRTSSGATDKQSQVAQNDARCDPTKYASKSAMPKECLDAQGTGAGAVGSTQGQSGGGAAGGSSASSSGSSPGSSSAGTSK
jgi:hypothetical protein